MEYVLIKKGKIIKFVSKPTFKDEFFWKIRYIICHNKNPTKPFIEYKYKSF